MLILTVLKGPDRGKRLELPDEPQLLGRSSEAVQLSDHTISRRHAELTPDDGSWYINDLGSSNGTFLNSVKVTDRKLLRPGDQIRVGSSILMFGQKNSGPAMKGNVAKQQDMDVSVEAMFAANDDSIILAVPEPNQAAVNQLKVVYDLLQVVGTVFEREALLEKIMEVIFGHFKPDRGYVLLLDEDDQNPRPVVVRNRSGQLDVETADVTISKTIVQHVIKHGVGVLSSNAMADKRFSGGDSIMQAGMQSTICVPIKFKDKTFGVIHIDSQMANYTFTEDQLRLLTAVGVQTGLAVSNLKLLEEHLRRERLAAAGEAVASLSHSIKNIIQGIRGGHDVVDLGMKKESLRVVAGGWEIVARNLERIYILTTNMLAFSKNREPEIEMTNLNELLTEIVQLVQPQYDKKPVALLTDFAEDVPEVPLDHGGIHQAVLNLLANALDATEPEKGVVSLSCAYDAKKQLVKIQVCDNGSGIDPDIRDQLFKPFQSTKGMGGTGLGLTVTKKLVEEHGGTIDFTSSKEEGTTFTMILPGTSQSVHKSGDTAAGELNAIMAEHEAQAEDDDDDKDLPDPRELPWTFT